MPNILALDLDGTLFYPKKKIKMIPKKNVKFIQDFIDAGNKVVLCSGRNMAYALKVEEKLERNIDVIGCNSAFIYTDKKLVRSLTLKTPGISDLVHEFTEKFGVKVWLLMSKDQSLVIAGEMSFIKKWLYKIVYAMQGVYAEKYVISNEIFEQELKTGQIYKLMMFFGLGSKSKEKAYEANKVLEEQYKDQLEGAWSDNFIELTPIGISKSNGLKEYCQINNFNHDDVYVVGDSGNDISMFKEYYEHSFCMNHSPEEVKKFAKYYIDTVADLAKYIGGK